MQIVLLCGELPKTIPSESVAISAAAAMCNPLPRASPSTIRAMITGVCRSLCFFFYLLLIWLLSVVGGRNGTVDFLMAGFGLAAVLAEMLSGYPVSPFTHLV